MLHENDLQAAEGAEEERGTRTEVQKTEETLLHLEGFWPLAALVLIISASSVLPTLCPPLLQAFVH